MADVTHMAQMDRDVSGIARAAGCDVCSTRPGLSGPVISLTGRLSLRSYVYCDVDSCQLIFRSLELVGQWAHRSDR